MAYIVMAYIVMAYIVMADRTLSCSASLALGPAYKIWVVCTVGIAPSTANLVSAFAADCSKSDRSLFSAASRHIASVCFSCRRITLSDLSIPIQIHLI